MGNCVSGNRDGVVDQGGGGTVSPAAHDDDQSVASNASDESSIEPSAIEKLIRAIGQGNPDGVRNALSNNISPEALNEARDESSPLLNKAVSFAGHPEIEEGDIDNIIGQLLEAGVTPNNQDREGNTALHEATSRGGNNDIIQKLLEGENVDLDIQNSEGKTALVNASRGDQEAAVALLEAGANTDIKDNEGKTALDYAHGDMELILYQSGAVLTEEQKKHPQFHDANYFDDTLKNALENPELVENMDALKAVLLNSYEDSDKQVGKSNTWSRFDRLDSLQEKRAEGFNWNNDEEVTSTVEHMRQGTTISPENWRAPIEKLNEYNEGTSKRYEEGLKKAETAAATKINNWAKGTLDRKNQSLESNRTPGR